jgi:NADPH-dependent curcumin reductase CurA
MAEIKKAKAKGGGIMNRGSLYAYVSKYTKEAVDVLVDLMKNGKQESVRMGAANALLDKTIPDLKAVEMTGENSGPLIIKIVDDVKNNNNE